MRSSHYPLEPITRAGREFTHYVRERPKRGIASLLLLGFLVAVGVLAWPELRRTVHIHRM
jgi:hypothetical protein